MAVIDRVDRTFLFANIGLLVCIAFLPFPTNLAAERFRDGGLRAAVLTHGPTQVAATIFMTFLWFHGANGRRLIADTADQRVISRHSRDVIAGTPMVGAATLIALWSPYTTLALIATLALFYVSGVGSSSVAESGVAGKPKATQRAAATLCLRGTGAGSRGCANRSLRTPSRHQKTEPGARAASRLRSSAEARGSQAGPLVRPERLRKSPRASLIGSG